MRTGKRRLCNQQRQRHWRWNRQRQSRIVRVNLTFRVRFTLMGNSSSSSGRTHHDETVDYGHLAPQGVYTGPRDWNNAIVSQLICSRRLAPFYRPLEDYEDNWTDDQILAARKELPDTDSTTSEPSSPRFEPTSNGHRSGSLSRRPGNFKEPVKPEATVYRGAVECPICFLVR